LELFYSISLFFYSSFLLLLYYQIIHSQITNKLTINSITKTHNQYIIINTLNKMLHFNNKIKSS
jgi:hypothetical protein